ncbi:MAG: hypothetical protein JSS02_33685 [Planctomycetes bacterium]|nr:hypothetical protein [Planctomycetota bacterium]
MVINRLFLCAPIATLLCGCGTLANLEGRTFPLMGFHEECPKAFGGVRRDIGWLSSVSMPYNLFFVADMPVSFAADIVTIPAVKNKQARWDAEREAEAEAVKDREPIE